MTAVSYIWRRYLDLPSERPDIKPPTSTPCASATHGDANWFSCDLYSGHDGPHASFSIMDRELVAVWADHTPSDPEVRAEG